MFIGVAEIINRLDGVPFDEHDEQLFEVSKLVYFYNLTTLATFMNWVTSDI